MTSAQTYSQFDQTFQQDKLVKFSRTLSQWNVEKQYNQASSVSSTKLCKSCDTSNSNPNSNSQCKSSRNDKSKSKSKPKPKPKQPYSLLLVSLIQYVRGRVINPVLRGEWYLVFERNFPAKFFYPHKTL